MTLTLVNHLTVVTILISILFLFIILFFTHRRIGRLVKMMTLQNRLMDSVIENLHTDIRNLKIELKRIDEDIYNTQKELVKLIPPNFDELWRERKRQRESGALEVSIPLPDLPKTSCKEKETCG